MPTSTRPPLSSGKSVTTAAASNGKHRTSDSLCRFSPLQLSCDPLSIDHDDGGDTADDHDPLDSGCFGQVQMSMSTFEFLPTSQQSSLDDVNQLPQPISVPHQTIAKQSSLDSPSSSTTLSSTTSALTPSGRSGSSNSVSRLVKEQHRSKKLSHSRSFGDSKHTGSDLMKSENHQRVRQRLLDQQRSQMEMKEHELACSLAKHQLAHERILQDAAESNMKRQQAKLWSEVTCTIRLFLVSVQTLRRAIKVQEMRVRLQPWIAVRARRWLRRARSRIAARSASKPTIAQLRFDKMLNLFSDAHLQHLINSLELRYYFLNETIIFMGSEDDEGYVLHQGTADVMMGPVKVFTLKAGMSFGTVGMISGEPRTASIVAREPCLVWYITRKKFESFACSSDKTVADALDMVSALRLTNMRTVYKALLDPTSFTQKFHGLFQGVSQECAADILSKGSADIVKKDCIVSLNASKYVLLLRGSLRVFLNTSPSSGGVSVMSAEEIVAHAVQSAVPGGVKITPRGGDMSQSVPSRTLPSSSSVVMTHQPTLCGGDFTHVVDIASPALVNFVPILLQVADQFSLPPFTIKTHGTACDCMFFSREGLLEADVVEVDLLRRNARNIHAAFIAPLSVTALQAVLLRGVKGETVVATSIQNDGNNDTSQSLRSRSNARATSESGSSFSSCGRVSIAHILSRQWQNLRKQSTTASIFSLDQKAAVLVKNSILTFGGDTSSSSEAMDGCFILLSGTWEGLSLQEARTEYPCLWPNVSTIFFSCLSRPTTTRVTSPRADVIRISRLSLLRYLLAPTSTISLKDDEIVNITMTFANALWAHYRTHASFVDPIIARSLATAGQHGKSRRRSSLRSDFECGPALRNAIAVAQAASDAWKPPHYLSHDTNSDDITVASKPLTFAVKSPSSSHHQSFTRRIISGVKTGNVKSGAIINNSPFMRVEVPSMQQHAVSASDVERPDLPSSATPTATEGRALNASSMIRSPKVEAGLSSLSTSWYTFNVPRPTTSCGSDDSFHLPDCSSANSPLSSGTSHHAYAAGTSQTNSVEYSGDERPEVLSVLSSMSDMMVDASTSSIPLSPREVDAFGDDDDDDEDACDEDTDELLSGTFEPPMPLATATTMTTHQEDEDVGCDGSDPLVVAKEASSTVKVYRAVVSPSPPPAHPNRSPGNDPGATHATLLGSMGSLGSVNSLSSYSLVMTPSGTAMVRRQDHGSHQHLVDDFERGKKQPSAASREENLRTQPSSPNRRMVKTQRLQQQQHQLHENQTSFSDLLLSISESNVDGHIPPTHNGGPMRTGGPSPSKSVSTTTLLPASSTPVAGGSSSDVACRYLPVYHRLPPNTSQPHRNRGGLSSPRGESNAKTPTGTTALLTPTMPPPPRTPPVSPLRDGSSGSTTHFTRGVVMASRVGMLSSEYDRAARKVELRLEEARRRVLGK